MTLPNIFDIENSNKVIQRINQLQSNSKALWGSMQVAQMLAHCNVTYELIYSEKHKKPNFLLKFILKSFVKKTVINTTPYIQNSRTGPQFLIKGDKDFEIEKLRLIDHIRKTQELGTRFFDNLPSHSFGPLKAEEWNNMFYKHLDHHLRQFGV